MMKWHNEVPFWMDDDENTETIWRSCHL